MIIFRYLIPALNGSLGRPTSADIYSADDIDKDIKSFINKGAERYAYTTLDDTDREIYTRLLVGILSYAEDIDIKEFEIDLDKLQVIYSCMRNDYPEIFWVDGSCNVYTSKDKITDCLPIYLYSRSSLNNMMDNLVTIRENAVEAMKDMDDYGKAMYIFDYIVDMTSYDSQSFNDYNSGKETKELELSGNIYGALLKQKALCEGYSKAYQYLAQACGLDCLYVTGISRNQGHAWNYVKIEGNYYGMDVTWCDPEGDVINKSHAYCLVDGDLLAKNHVTDTPYKLPACNGGKYDYFKHNDYELSVFDKDKVADMLYRSFSSGNRVAEIRCENAAVYSSFMASIKSQEIFECFGMIESAYGVNFDSINYGGIEDVMVIRIEL